MTSIIAERTGLAKVGMTLRRREQWGARRSYTDARSVSEPATKQFVHITVTNPGNYNSFDAHARAIEAIGISRFSNTGISYNRLFMAGTRDVYEAQPIGRRGAHTVNDFRRSTCTTSGCPSRGTSLTAPSWNLNVNARSYVYCANVHHSVPDHVIDDIARAMAADRLAGFVSRTATIHGHRCVSGKSCPGDKMWSRMRDLEQRVEHYLSNGLNGDDDMPITRDDARMIAEEVANYGTTSLASGNSSTLLNQVRWAHKRADTAAARSAPTSRIESKLDALLAANEGLDTEAIIARIDEVAEQGAAERAEILDLVAAVTSGEATAEDVVRLIGEKLAATDA